MLLNNNKNKCVIYDKYFIDDMYAYQFDENSLKLNFQENNTSFGSTNVDMSNLLSTLSTLSVTQNEKDIWYPAFIDLANSHIETKTLFRGAPSISSNLGIENAVSFSPKFKSWRISGDHTMAIDWILTSPLLPFIPAYGILFWYKESSIHDTFYESKDLPENSVVVPAQDYSYSMKTKSVSVNPSNGIKLVKIDKDKFYIFDDKNDIIFDDKHVLPSFQNKIFSISEYIKAKNLKTDPTKYKIYKNSLIDNRPNLSIYISDGEFYSYFLSEETLRASYLSEPGVSTKSYLSPTIYPIYREIYNILTLRYTKNIEKIIVEDSITNSGKIQTIHKPIFSLSQSRLFKKLVYALCTFPLIDRTTISILNTQEVFDIVNEYINKNVKSIDEEKNVLYETLILLSSKFLDLSIDYRTNPNLVINSGFIDNKKSLFNKLISKYGSKLRLSKGDVKLTYTPGLINGPHVKINQDIISKCKTNLNNDVVFNNIIFDVDPFIAESSVSSNSSSFVIKHKNVLDRKVSIPLWDITRKDLMTKDIIVTAGPDVETSFDNSDTEIEYSLDSAILEFGDRGNPTLLAGEEPEILWTKISGPDCLRFSNFALSKITTNSGGFVSNDSGLRYLNSTDTNPILYIKSPGKYVLQLKVKTSFGVVYDTVTVHVTQKGVYERSEPLIKSEIKNLRPTNGLTVIVPNIRECAFGKQGVFSVSYSDCNVEIPQLNSIPIIKPFGNPLSKFALPMPNDDKGKPSIKEGLTTLSITYKCNNTIIDISRIILKNMLDSKEDCYQCEGFYEGILDNDGFFIDNNGYNLFLDAKTREIIEIPTPLELSTSRSIIKSYGDFPADVVENLNIDIPGHPKPGTLLESIATTGNLLNQPINEDDKKIKYICHDTAIVTDSSQLFEKGCFHPYSGWIETVKSSPSHNKSAVLKFAPNYRPVQTFKGIGFDQLTNDFLEEKAVVYKSSITLSVNKIAHDFVAPAQAKAEDIQRLTKEHDKQELEDHSKNYGYRSIANDFGKNLAINDEYLAFYSIESEFPVPSNEYCNEQNREFEYGAAYEMMKPGTFIPKEKRDSEDPHYRFYREGAGSIQGIEIKLNFLNYINPKDLVVWLEIDPCTEVQEALNPPRREDGTQRKPKDRWYTGSYKQTIEEYTNLPDTVLPASKSLKSYLYRLLDLNNNTENNDTIVLPNYNKPFSDKEPRSIDGKYRIYLLNQDHIFNFSNNSTIYFRDNQDKYHNSTNLNTNYSIYDKQNISQSNNFSIFLSPTISAPGFSDYESIFFKKTITENNLTNNGHKFEKIKSMPIFGTSTLDERSPGNADSTKFTLCIAVLNETDDGLLYDRVITSDYLTDTDGIVARQRSGIPNNSLCSWELILHKRANSHGFLPGDALGDIDYENKDPVIPGYNFISNFKDKEYLLPPAVYNAPNQYFTNGTYCRYSKEALNSPNYETTPLNILPVIFLAPATIVGGLIATIQVDSQLANISRNIVDWFNNERRQRQQEAFNRENFVPSYEKYSFGGSNKALVSISKDKKIWYKTEASVYRYDNSITMKNNKYKYYHLHVDSPLRAFAMFNISMVNVKNEQSLVYYLVDSIKKQIFIDFKDNLDNLTITSLKSRIDQLNKEIAVVESNLAKKTNISSTDEEYLNNLKLQLSNYQKTLNNIGLGLQEKDILEIVNTKQTYVVKQNENKLYLNPLGSIVNLLDNSRYAFDNNIYDIFRYSKNVNSFNKNVIQIRGSRAYYFFQKETEIRIYQPKDLTRSEEIYIENLQKKIEKIQNETEIRIIEKYIWDAKHSYTTNTIKAKGIINYEDEKYTLFILDKQVTTQDSIISVSKLYSDKIVFFDTDYSTIMHEDSLPINVWSNEKNIDFENTSPKTSFSTFGEGSYGYGSSVIEPKVLYNQTIQSRITPFFDQIDVHKNSIVNSHNIKLINGQGTIKNTTSLSGGFGYTLEDIKNVSKIYDNIIVFKNASLFDNIQKIIDSYQYEVYKKDFSDYYFIDISIQDYETISDTGDVIFDKDIRPNIIYKFKQSFDLVKVPSLGNRSDTTNYNLVQGEGSTDNNFFVIGRDTSFETQEAPYTLKTAVSFKSKGKTRYSIRVRMADPNGQSFERTFTVPKVATYTDALGGALWKYRRRPHRHGSRLVCEVRRRRSYFVKQKIRIN